MKSKRILFIGLIAGTVGFFGPFAYFVGGVSSVYDPLKSYSYSLTKDELEQRLIQTIKANPNLTFHPTDTTGTDRSDLDYHADILIKIGIEEYEFNIKYNKESRLCDNKVKSEISLIGAFDIGHKTGGYIPEAPGVDRLINIFEKAIIEKLS